MAVAVEGKVAAVEDRVVAEEGMHYCWNWGYLELHKK
jgi:hypothetical protein